MDRMPLVHLFSTITSPLGVLASVSKPVLWHSIERRLVERRNEGASGARTAASSGTRSGVPFRTVYANSIELCHGFSWYVSSRLRNGANRYPLGRLEAYPRRKEWQRQLQRDLIYTTVFVKASCTMSQQFEAAIEQAQAQARERGESLQADGDLTPERANWALAA